MALNESNVLHFYANQTALTQATGKLFGVSNTKVFGSSVLRLLTCSFTRDNAINPMSIDYSHTLVGVAYGQGNFFVYQDVKC